MATTAADLERAHAAGETAVLLTCEGGDFLEGASSRLAEVHAQGVSSLTLVHYRVNELGDIQTEPPVHGGLTDVRPRGGAASATASASSSTAPTPPSPPPLGVLETSDVPVMVSHSHLDHPDRSHPRLLSDDHARAVADAGGLVGAWPSGVTSATFDDFVDEILRLVELIGVDHVAIGTDLDANYKPVVTVPRPVRHPRRPPRGARPHRRPRSTRCSAATSSSCTAPSPARRSWGGP